MKMTVLSTWINMILDLAGCGDMTFCRNDHLHRVWCTIKTWDDMINALAAPSDRSNAPVSIQLEPKGFQLAPVVSIRD
jgi:hypothetical protein